ncbi:MAG: pirin family protein [Nitrospirales bacterium]|nr:pirin family protein [Nitrospira sp.]MDR4502139.1 pirin family protein [Nitrospirales bacterium]
MKEQYRKVKTMVEPKTVMEGAGVKLRRSLGGEALNYLDPFLLFDHFGSRHAEDYRAGFPMHPHRGIETVTYMLSGEVEHRDTLGNAGKIGAGDVQWMTAGGGILHEEMPLVRPEGNEGFQLWVNLPAKLKMTKPRYQDISAEKIPEVTLNSGASVRVIAGSVEGTEGAVRDIAANPTYLDVKVPASGSFVHPIPEGHSAFLYVFEGNGTIQDGDKEENVSSPAFIVLDEGNMLKVAAHDKPVRFLLIAAKPLHEPIARYGPFVMNTQAEIQQALHDLKNGTFIWSEGGTHAGSVSS